MSFFSSIWPKRGKDLAGAASQNPSVIHSTTDSHSPVQSGGSPSPTGIRKDIIRVILKQTLTHNGIPTAWLAAQALVTKSREHSTGLHIRFSILHWDVRLMQHAFDFQEDFNDRLLALDPQAEAWMFGYSWQFKVPGISPGGMPHPGSWTSDTKVDNPRVTKGAVVLAGGSADVISGPVVISRQPASSADDVRSDLKALKALRLADVDRHQQTVHTFAPTEPTKLSRDD